MKQLSLDQKLFQKMEAQAAYSARLRSSMQEVLYLKQSLEAAQPNWERVSEKNWLLIGSAVEKICYILEWEAYMLYFHERQSDLSSKCTIEGAMELTKNKTGVYGFPTQISYLSGSWNRIRERISILLGMLPYKKETIWADREVRQNLLESKTDLDKIFERMNKKLI